ncbi:MAG: GNAT family N-acetyltransferase [Calditrichaeota bacterium]|nr:GNAT family N-acetyltransferase [Calditrichota bacterium]
MSFAIEAITSNDRFMQLRDHWTGLLANSNIASPFLTWEWMYTWWTVFNSPQDGKQLLILAAWDGEKLVGLLPGYIAYQRHMGMRIAVFSFLGSEYESSDYLTVIQENPGDPRLPAQLFEFLFRQQQFPIDLILCANILEDNPLLKTLENIASKTRSRFYNQHHRICPFVPVHGKWEDFLGNLSSNMRQQVKRRRKKFFESTGNSFRLVENPAEVPEEMETLFRLHEKRFASKRVESKFNRDSRKVFHGQISRIFQEQNILRLFELTHEKQVVASLYCFEFAGELFYFQAGLDPVWEPHSVGMVLMSKAIEYAHDRQLKRFDFMRGEETYKFRWTRHTRNMLLAYVGITRAGKNALIAKETFNHTKSGIRRLINGTHPAYPLPEKNGNPLLKLPVK